MLAAAAIAEPSSEWTWPEYKSLAQRLTRDLNGDGEADQFGTNRFDWRAIIHYYMAEGGRFFSEGFTEFLPDRQAAITAFEFAASFDLDRLVSASWVNDFLKGNLALVLTHLPSTVNQGSAGSRLFQVGSTIQPRHSNGSRMFFVTSNQLGINPNSSEEQQRAAWTFIRWANSPEGYARASREAFGACQLYPARRDSALSDYCSASDVPGIRPELSMEIITNFGVPELTPPTWPEINSRFYSAWTENVLTGRMAPAAFYDSVIASINAALREARE